MIENIAHNLKQKYYEFYKCFWFLYSSEKLILSKHIEYCCKELQLIGQHIINRTKPEYDWYIFNLPPGGSKSSMISVIWGCWLLANDLSIFIINSSYSGELSEGFVRKSKQILNSDTFISLFGKIEFTKETGGHYETKKNGGVYATSTGGTTTGVHGNVDINDDPLSVSDSYSNAKRNTAIIHTFQTLPTRVRDKEITPHIIVMQRLHEDDPTGNLLKKNLRIKHICLPAELSENTTKGLEYLYTDNLLDPIRFSKEILNKKREELGSYGYSGQFEQRPAPKGGEKIKGEWFLKINIKELKPIVWDMWIDSAYTNRTANDPTGIMICGFFDSKLYIKLFRCGYWEMPELLKIVSELAIENGLTAKSLVYIEPKASGMSLRQLLKNQLHLNPVDIFGHLVSEGKEARCQTASPKIQSGRVFLCEGTGNWHNDFISQLEGYPNVKHDEAIDLIGYAVDKYFLTGNKIQSHS